MVIGLLHIFSEKQWKKNNFLTTPNHGHVACDAYDT